MKKLLLSAIIIAILPALFPDPALGVEFINYENANFNYKIIIPKSWVKTVTDKDATHIMQVSKDCNTSIKVEALKSKDKIDNIIRERKWKLRKIDAGLRNIIETDMVALKSKARGKLLVFEYFSKKSFFLHRTFVTRKGDYVYIIECISPVWRFYKVEDVFTTALASFGNLTEKGPAEKPAEKIPEEKIEEKKTGEKPEVIEKKESEEPGFDEGWEDEGWENEGFEDEGFGEEGFDEGFEEEGGDFKEETF